MENIEIFRNQEFGEVRVMDINGEPWFVGKDVATILGYERPRKAVSDHVDAEDRDEAPIQDSIGRMQNTPIINESGLYSLILSSKLPNAKKFKHWVTGDVLPSIRKHGAYMTEKTLEKALADPDFLIQLATNLKQEKEKNKRLEEENERMKPKEIFTDAVTASKNSILVRELAKLIRQNGVDIGEKRLYKWMRSNGYICKNSTEPTQRAMELGLFERIVRTIQRGDDLPLETVVSRVTGKGQVYFVNKFLKEKYKKELSNEN